MANKETKTRVKEQGVASSASKNNGDREGLLDLYYQMVVIRQLEERSAELYQQGKIGGFLHLYIGQEAVSTGLVAARKPEDRVITAYRDHGVAINCGIPAKIVMAELLGKATGCSKGRGGSMHLADVSKNFFGGHAIVGAHLPIAAGLAIGDQYQNSDAVTICMFGDGATNIGFFHEALNISKVWNLKVLWVCENNQYGMGTSTERASAVSDIQRKADGYGMPNAEVDGMDVMTVREVTKQKLEEIRAGSGPQFLEIMTYRYRGHSMGDPERYRKAAEIHKWQENDPIGIYRKYLLSKKICSTRDLDALDTRALQEIDEAVAFAESSPDPSADELFRHIYVEA
jgi:pyruvate dehydrogenase E1 component alpha subunit